MRKKTKSFALTLTTRVRAAMLLIAMLCCATGAWADEVEIGDGTSTTKYVPIGTYYNYSITEQLYTADEIGTAGTITSISFHYTGAAAKDFPIAVYMANVDVENLESVGISLADANEVFNGTLSVPAEDGWVTIELDTPFAYDGTSNLLIGINKGYVYYFNGDTWYCTATESQMTRYNQNDGDAYDITATVPGQAINNRPNIKIDITPSGGGVVYNKPTDLTVTALTSNGATISWTAPEGSPTGYAYQYKKASDADWSAETSVNTTSVALSNLEPAKAYNFRVKAVYGTDGESKFVSIKFTTDCDVITTFPWTENFESYASGNFNHPCWVNEHIDGSGSYIFKISNSSLGGNSTNQLQLPDMSTGTLTKLVLPAMDLNGNYQLVLDVYRSNSTYNDSYASEGIRVFVSADGQIEGATEIGFIPRQYAVSSTIVPAEAAVGWYTYEVPIPMTGTCHLILRGESQYCTSTYMDNFVVELVPTCRKPTGVNASDVTKHSATIGWTSEATEWVVAYKADADEEFTEVPAVTENSYALTGLAAETTYTVKVRTNCGDGDYSDWTAPVNFTTPIAAPVPTNVAVSNVTKNSATVSWVSEATSFNVQYKATSAEEWQTTIATENSITITGLTPETEYQVQVQGNYGDLDGLSAWSAAVTFTTDVAAPVPTNVVVSNVTKNSATVSWVSEATSFNVQYKATSAEEWQTTIATENSITITGLTPETEYQVQVQGNYGDLDGLSTWSAAVSFTTDIPFPAPTAVAANHVLATTAEISWTGNDDATSYNLRYGATTSVYCDFESVEAWSVDDFAPFTAYDGDGGSTYTIQDVTFTNQGYTGSVITMENGGISESWSAHSGDKFGCFMDCTTPPNNDFFITPEVTITEGCTFSFWARSYTNQYGLERIKVGVYDGNGTFSSYLAGSADGYVEVPTNWTKYSYDLSAYIGQTIQLAINCVSNDAFALFIDDVSINMPPTEWNTPITDITTSSYQMEGLTPETTYVVQVQAVYEGGSSTWTSTNFTTIALDAVPFNLQTADVTATTATLNWDGAQDSYNVRYRKNPVYYFTTFNTNEDVEGWSYSSAIYGLDDTAYNIPGSSNYFLAMGWNSTDEEFIVSPALPAYPSGSTLEFYHYYYSAENTFQIGYSTTTANHVDDFTWSDPISSVSAGDAYTAKYSQELPDGVKYIAFRATASDRSHCIFIDDFKIYDSSVSVDDWDETISNVDATTLAITGLDPETEYEWQVQGNLTEGTTAWSTPAFFTTTTDIELANDATGNSAIIADNAGKVADVTLSGRTLYKDGEWNTICLPFDVDLTDTECPFYGATAKTLTDASIADTHVELTFGDAVTTLTAGTPYIIKWDGDGTNNIVEPVFNGVTIKNSTEADRTISKDGGNVKFIGYYDAFGITAADTNIFYMTADSQLKATGIDRWLKSCRAYFQFADGVEAREFVLNFGDGESTTTGVVSMDNGQWSMDNGQWYTVNGMKLDKQPTTKGVYIRNGRKVVIK